MGSLTVAWTEDKCPTCDGPAVNACRCPLNDRQCANGHEWRRGDNNEAILLQSVPGKHGIPIPDPAPSPELAALRRDVKRLEARIEELEKTAHRHETPTEVIQRLLNTKPEPTCDKKVTQGFFTRLCNKPPGHEGAC